MIDTELETAVPSPELVAALVAANGSGLEFEQQLAAIGAWERVISWATACQAELLVAVDQAVDAAQYGWEAPDAARSLGDQLGLVLGVSGGSAQRRVTVADRLVRKLPAVHSALQRGAVTVHHARLAAGGAAVLDEPVAQAVAAAVMVDDGWRTPSQFQEAFARIVLELDPEGAEQRHRDARRGRRVSHRAEPDGMTSLWALLPAEAGQAVSKRLDALARSSAATNTPGDERTLDERRADALVACVCGSGDDRPPSRGTHGPEVNVVVSWSTLIGLDDAPADLAGYGPIDAATARRIAADPSSTWHRLLVDPGSGRLLDYGRTVYRPPKDLRDFVTARDRTCRFPTCDRPAYACDVDHRHDWADGGTTSATCTDCLCRRHHRLKHAGGWTHTRDPATGESTWTDPSGRTWPTPPALLPTPAPVEPPAAPQAP